MIENQPDLFCPKGHLIPANSVVIKTVIAGIATESVVPVIGKDRNSRKASNLVCEECAIEASEGMPPQPKKVSALNRSRNPHKDQESFLGKVPDIFIG